MKKVVLLLTGLVITPSLFAQSISGTVTDSDGNPLAGANVEVVGGFYLFPDFSNHLDFFKLKNINTSNQFCSQLLKDTGVALLPGEVFGRPKEEFTARLAYVNFDGTEALRTSKKLMDNDQFNIEDLDNVITSLKSGICSVVDWLDSN